MKGFAEDLSGEDLRHEGLLGEPFADDENLFHSPGPPPITFLRHSSPAEYSFSHSV
jgi:hypothetical protein